MVTCSGLRTMEVAEEQRSRSDTLRYWWLDQLGTLIASIALPPHSSAWHWLRETDFQTVYGGFPLQSRYTQSGWLGKLLRSIRARAQNHRGMYRTRIDSKGSTQVCWV